jgi:hypothetical protein
MGAVAVEGGDAITVATIGRVHRSVDLVGEGPRSISSFCLTDHL